MVTDASCRIAGPDDLVGAASLLAPLGANGGSHETQMPLSGSPVLDRIPAARCLSAPLPTVYEGEQHLAAEVPDVRLLLRGDQRGVARAQNGRCDVGAVEVP